MLDAAGALRRPPRGGRALRRAGLAVGTDRVVEFTRALKELNAARREDVYWAGRITLCSRREDLELYDKAFRAFWEEIENTKALRPPKTRFSVSLADDSVQPPKNTVE